MSERSVDEILETLVVEPDPVYWAGHRDGAAAERDRIREAVERYAAIEEAARELSGRLDDVQLEWGKYMELDAAHELLREALEAPHVE